MCESNAAPVWVGKCVWTVNLDGYGRRYNASQTWVNYNCNCNSIVINYNSSM